MQNEANNDKFDINKQSETAILHNDGLPANYGRHKSAIINQPLLTDRKSVV